MKILYLGASGLLGKHLVPLLKQDHEVLTPSHKKYDVLQFQEKLDCDLVINSIGYTDVVKAEKERTECFNVNSIGTLRISSLYDDKPLVQISSEYAHKPTNWYARTKQIGEMIALEHPTGVLIIRTLFKPRPFPHPKAFIDQFTRGDYADVIAEKIAKEINEWDMKTKLIYVGTTRKTIFDLARETRHDVLPISVHDIKGVVLPQDYQ